MSVNVGYDELLWRNEKDPRKETKEKTPNKEDNAINSLTPSTTLAIRFGETTP
jgi:hypothetical protein